MLWNVSDRFWYEYIDVINPINNESFDSTSYSNLFFPFYSFPLIYLKIVSLRFMAINQCLMSIYIKKIIFFSSFMCLVSILFKFVLFLILFVWFQSKDWKKNTLQKKEALLYSSITSSFLANMKNLLQIYAIVHLNRHANVYCVYPTKGRIRLMKLREEKRETSVNNLMENE